MSNAIKYYVYISDAKVDMPFSQIPRPLLKKIASELSINLSIPLFGIGAGIKFRGDTPEEMRYSKLKIVTRYIEKHAEVGTVKEPKT